VWGNHAQIIRGVIDATDESTVLEHNMHVRHPDSLAQGYWGKGRVTLIGDAAHPMRPASGMHDCICTLFIVTCIPVATQLVKGSTDWHLVRRIQ